MHIELVALEVTNDILNDRCAPHVLRWLRERHIKTTIEHSLGAGTFAPNVVRIATTLSDIRASRLAGYGLVVAIARTDEARADAIEAGADLVLPAFASVPGALLAVMSSPRRITGRPLRRATPRSETLL
jgi:hypothetical protein